MNKIYFQGTFGAYSHLAALSIDPSAEIIPCKTFDECFSKASKDTNSKLIIPESNRLSRDYMLHIQILKTRFKFMSNTFWSKYRAKCLQPYYWSK